MNTVVYDRKYGNPSAEVLRKILQSKKEVEKLPKRTIRCPICGFKIEEVFGYGTAYVKVKCRKCKFEQPLNLAYFRRIKGFRRYNKPHRVNVKRTFNR